MPNEFEWPTDPEFRRIAAKIADAVTVAINSGVKITTLDDAVDENCKCTLGCVGATNGNSHPYAMPGLFQHQGDTSDFFLGFEGGSEYRSGRRFYRLGLAYRRRFVEGVK